MARTDSYGVNEQGHFTLGGMDVLPLAREYGTPLMLMDEDLIRENMRMYRDSIEKHYGGQGLCCYASKAFSCKQIYRVCQEEGIGVDVVSMGELYTAMSVGFDPHKICYHGNNKTRAELRYALEQGVDRIVVDSYRELDLLDSIAGELGVKAGILLRLSPGIDAHTHAFIRTGQIDSKFGFAISLGDAMKAVKLALSKPNLELRGVHCHIGSQIFEYEPFQHAAEVMLTFLADVKRETGVTVRDLNLGGGFGIRYTAEDDPLPYGEYMAVVSEALHKTCEKLDMPLPYVIIEPGRSIVGSAGVTVYEIGGIKEIQGVRTYVSIDGGMTDNVRYALYGSKYDFLIANRANEPKSTSVTVAGRCCESGDLLGKDVPLQSCTPGDYLVVLATGAYNYSMASNYNRVPRPAVVMLREGTARLAIRRESLDDLVRNDL